MSVHSGVSRTPTTTKATGRSLGARVVEEVLQSKWIQMEGYTRSTRGRSTGCLVGADVPASRLCIGGFTLPGTNMEVENGPKRKTMFHYKQVVPST